MELKVHDQEIRLQKLWKSGRIFQRELTTGTGKTVEVLYAGSENFDAGPDFKNAIIKLDGALLKGDIEVHLETSGWYAHQHHTDPAYNKVILHIVSGEKPNQALIEREDGVKVQQLFIDLENMSPAFGERTRPEKSDRVLVVDDCPLSEKDETRILATIQAAAQRRLNEKVEQLTEKLSYTSWDQLIYEKIMEALGYSKNQAQFRSLANVLTYETIRSEMQWVSEEVALKKCAALLFGTAGLLPSQNPRSETAMDAETVQYLGPIENLWSQMSHRLEIKPLPSHEWQFFRLRPQNFPTRRIAGMVELIHRCYKQGFLTGLDRIFSGNSQDYRRLAGELESFLVVKTAGFWASHYRWEDGADLGTRRLDPTLIGRDRARDIIVNTVIPVMSLYSHETGNGLLSNLVYELFGRFPKLTENSITRAMNRQLFGDKRPRSGRSAGHQQGMIYLHKRYCQSLKCSECLKFLNPS
ncbi:MAG: DUF2851 family protein [bacterium]